MLPFFSNEWGVRRISYWLHPEAEIELTEAALYYSHPHVRCAKTAT
jgi:hypothetical protein